MSRFTGQRIAFGADQFKLIQDIPQGVRLKVKRRIDQPVVAFLKSGGGISKHYIVWETDHWELGPDIGCNLRFEGPI